MWRCGWCDPIASERPLVHWSGGDETSYQSLLQHFNNNVSVGFPFSSTLHMDGGAIKGHSSTFGQIGLNLTLARSSLESLKQTANSQRASSAVPWSIIGAPLRQYAALPTKHNIPPLAPHYRAT
ncbi:hypothetical protein EYF80_004931 [Liparis tanakae]|uniref:Uncharacterized protein n=1 Tax=Liparis tanakae TaxID=230148 RepID=A0A4Z2J3W3_9TELE|nr:hypothetical protein EYF80_004931 [Liparis tanakae]